MSHRILARSVTSSLWNGTCPQVNTPEVDTEGFWEGSFWDSPHKIGWTLAGVFFALTTLIAFINIYRHCTNYRKP